MPAMLIMLKAKHNKPDRVKFEDKKLMIQKRNKATVLFFKIVLISKINHARVQIVSTVASLPCQ